MKIINHLAAVILGTISLFGLSSCEKNLDFGYGNSEWHGSYPTVMYDSSGEEIGEFPALIGLYFSQSALECTVHTGIDGLIAANRVTYSVEWTDNDSFSLYEEQNGEKLDHYRGTIEDDTLYLEMVSWNTKETIVELIRIEKNRE